MPGTTTNLAQRRARRRARERPFPRVPNSDLANLSTGKVGPQEASRSGPCPREDRRALLAFDPATESDHPRPDSGHRGFGALGPFAGCPAAGSSVAAPTIARARALRWIVGQKLYCPSPRDRKILRRLAPPGLTQAPPPNRPGCAPRGVRHPFASNKCTTRCCPGSGLALSAWRYWPAQHAGPPSGDTLRPRSRPEPSSSSS